MVPYKVDTGSDGNIMPLYIYKKLFPWDNNRAVGGNKRYKHQTENHTTKQH